LALGLIVGMAAWLLPATSAHAGADLPVGCEMSYTNHADTDPNGNPTAAFTASGTCVTPAGSSTVSLAAFGDNDLTFGCFGGFSVNVDLTLGGVTYPVQINSSEAGSLAGPGFSTLGLVLSIVVPLVGGLPRLTIPRFDVGSVDNLDPAQDPGPPVPFVGGLAETISTVTCGVDRFGNQSLLADSGTLLFHDVVVAS
jgi:hypothetical protein